MAIKLPSHLHRSRSGTLHFRIAIPPDLRHHFASREIYRSLRTPSVRDAAHTAQALSIAFKRVFREIRQRTMSDNYKAPDTQTGTEFGLVVEFDFDEFMRPKNVKVKSDPNDAPDAMQSALSTIIGAAQGAGAGPMKLPTKAQITKNISEYVEPYLGGIPADHRPNEKTLESYRAAINTFIKIVGDKPLHELSAQDQNRFEDVIVKLPANCTKVATARGLSIDDVLLLGLEPISIQSAKNIARRTNVFLAWAFRREGGKPPFQLLDTVKLTKKRKAAIKRRAFTDEELRIVFNPATLGTSTQASPYMFWVPLIGVHTGMRINEIAQLLLSDFTVRDGIQCFNVTDAPDPKEESDLIRHGKSVKTEAAKRVVPVHTRLVELGLLEYAESLRAAGHARLFPDLEGSRDGPGQPASKQFARYCDRIKLVDETLVFHSFRHGAVGRMRSARVPKELRKVVVGHSSLEDTHDGYGDMQNDYSVADKRSAIDSLCFDGILDYTLLKSRVPTVDSLSTALARNARRPKPLGEGRPARAH